MDEEGWITEDWSTLSMADIDRLLQAKIMDVDMLTRMTKMPSFRYVPHSGARRPDDEYSFTSYDTDHDQARGHGDVVLGEVLAVRDEEVP